MYCAPCGMPIDLQATCSHSYIKSFDIVIVSIVQASILKDQVGELLT